MSCTRSEGLYRGVQERSNQDHHHPERDKAIVLKDHAETPSRTHPSGTRLREVVLSDTAPGSDAVSPGPSLRSTHAGVEGGSPESPRAARGSMASRWENSFVLLTLSLEVQRPGCEPSPWLSRVGAASGLSGRLAHAQPACGCPDTWPLVDLAGQGPLRLNSRPKRYYLLRPSPGTLEDCLSSQGHVLLTIFTPTMLFSHRS